MLSNLPAVKEHRQSHDELHSVRADVLDSITHSGYVTDSAIDANIRSRKHMLDKLEIRNH